MWRRLSSPGSPPAGWFRGDPRRPGETRPGPPGSGRGRDRAFRRTCPRAVGPARRCVHAQRRALRPVRLPRTAGRGGRRRPVGTGDRRPAARAGRRGPDRDAQGAGGPMERRAAGLGPAAAAAAARARGAARVGVGYLVLLPHPKLFRHLPAGTRIYRARTALGPAGASWLRPRVEGEIPILAGQSVRPARGRARWGHARPGGQRWGPDRAVRRPCHRGHWLPAGLCPADVPRRRAAPNCGRLPAPPSWTSDYQSSVPGLYFVGPGVAPTFGPVMRFVYGADHAARPCRGCWPAPGAQDWLAGERVPDRRASLGAARVTGGPAYLDCDVRLSRECVPDRRASLGRRPGRAVGAGFCGACERPDWRRRAPTGGRRVAGPGELGERSRRGDAAG